MSKHIACAALLTLAHVFPASFIEAQDASSLSLAEARALARAASPDIVAAREAVAQARGLEAQAGAFANPTLGYTAERTSGGGETNRQQIAGVEQAVEIGGQRRARREAARLRTQSAEAGLQAAEALVDFEVARRYALAVTAERRVSLARTASAAFVEAARVSERRLAAGDISTYADQRLRLEAARYAALEAEAVLASRSARSALSAVILADLDSLSASNAALSDSTPRSATDLQREALLAHASSSRADLRAMSLEADASAADARLAARERIPTPVFSAGLKSEESAGNPESMKGFAAGFSVPLPLWDRRRGAIQAAEAGARRRVAERESLRRRIASEVMEVHGALTAAEQQIALLAPQLGARAAAALRSAQFAYAEGEITLLEWLDAVRAYHEAESGYASLVAETMIRRAALERAVGTQLENVR